MEIKNLTNLLEVAESEDIDRMILEYILVLSGAKRTLENVKEFVLNSDDELINKVELLSIINNES